jgi:hypothetical protein
MAVLAIAGLLLRQQLAAKSKTFTTKASIT